MVGLSVVLDGQNSQLELIVNKLDTASNGNTDRLQPQLNNKAMVVHQTHIPSSSLPYSRTNNNVPPAPTANPSSFPAGRETELSSSYSRPPPVFLDSCCFCKAKLMPGRDIYMYKGDGGFCSVECRYRQISLDEQADVMMMMKKKKKKKH